MADLVKVRHLNQLRVANNLNSAMVKASRKQSDSSAATLPTLKQDSIGLEIFLAQCAHFRYCRYRSDGMVLQHKCPFWKEPFLVLFEMVVL